MTAMLTDQQVAQAADFLDSAAASGSPLPPIPESCRPQTASDGGRIYAERWRRNPRPAIAWKAAPVGGEIVTAPFFEGMLLRSPAELPASDFNFCIVEAEIAFRIGRDLAPSPGALDEAAVLDAVESVFAVIEAPNIRYADGPSVGVPSIAADGIGAQALIIGPEISGWRDRDLSALPLVITDNGEPVAEGRPPAERPDPVAMLARFLNALSEQGRTVDAGQIITTGAAGLVAPGSAGHGYVARFDGIGEVEMTLA